MHWTGTRHERCVDPDYAQGGRASARASDIKHRMANTVRTLTLQPQPSALHLSKVNCASAYEGETSCSLQRCEPDETGRPVMSDVCD